MSPVPRQARATASAAACLALVGALVGGLAAPAASQTSHPGAGRSHWWSDLGVCDSKLLHGHWRRGLRCSEALGEKVSEQGWYEPDLGEVLANAEVQRAIAEANLGRDDDALWDWYEAQALRRDVAATDLAPYGKAADLLASHPLRRRGEYPPGYSAPKLTVTSDYRAPVEAERPPVTVHKNGAALRKHLPPVHLEVLYDTHGVAHQPVVISDWSHPITVYWALETLRASPPARPALLDGRPVATLEDVLFEWGGDRRP